MRVSMRKIPWIEVGILLVACLLRVVLLDLKPAHFDEGVNGWFADQMTRQGFFRYDPTNYHGPLHFYVVFLSQTVFGRNLWALRLSAIVSSLLAVAALLRYREFFGPMTARLAALAMAVSPACVFFGRYAIHESWMMLFQIVFLWGLLGVWEKGDRRFYRAVVLSSVGMMLVKETYLIHLVSFLLAALVLGLWQRVVPSRNDPPLAFRNLLAANAAGVGTACFVFFAAGLFMPAPHSRLFAEGLAFLGARGVVLPALPWLLGIALGVAAVGAFWVFVFPRLPKPGSEAARWTLLDRLGMQFAALAIIVFFYTGTFFDRSILSGLHDTFLTWVHTGTDAAGHAKTSYEFSFLGLSVNTYWLALFARYEWPALIGLAACVRFVLPSDARIRYLAISAGGTLLAFSLIPYKTPWCVLSLVWPFFLLFGAIVAEGAGAFARLGRREPVPLLLGIGVIAASLVPTLRLNFLRYDDPEEPYVYVQTSREMRVLTEPLLRQTRRDPAFFHIRGSFFLDSYYPLPWVLGDFTKIGYYKPTDPPESAKDSAVIVVEEGDQKRIESQLSGAYFKKPFRLRDGMTDCVAYFRADVFSESFGGDTPVSFAGGLEAEETAP